MGELAIGKYSNPEAVVKAKEWNIILFIFHTNAFPKNRSVVAYFLTFLKYIFKLVFVQKE